MTLVLISISNTTLWLPIHKQGRSVRGLPTPPRCFCQSANCKFGEKLDTVGKMSTLFHYNIVVADCVVIVIVDIGLTGFVTIKK